MPIVAPGQARFLREIVGYDWAGFFTRNSAVLRTEIDNVLRALHTPDAP
jgi:hypothetical protein